MTENNPLELNTIDTRVIGDYEDEEIISKLVVQLAFEVQNHTYRHCIS